MRGLKTLIIILTAFSALGQANIRLSRYIQDVPEVAADPVIQDNELKLILSDATNGGDGVSRSISLDYLKTRWAEEQGYGIIRVNYIWSIDGDDLIIGNATYGGSVVLSSSENVRIEGEEIRVGRHFVFPGSETRNPSVGDYLGVASLKGKADPRYDNVAVVGFIPPPDIPEESAYFETRLIQDTPFTGTLGLEDELVWQEVSGTDDFEFKIRSNFQYVKFLKSGKYKFAFTLDFGKAQNDNVANRVTAILKRRTPSKNTELDSFTLYFGTGDKDSRYFESQYVDVAQNAEYQLVLQVQPANANYLKANVTTFNIYEENHGGGSGNRVPTLAEVLVKGHSTGGADIALTNDNYIVNEDGEHILGLAGNGSTVVKGDNLELGHGTNNIILGSGANRLSIGSPSTGYDIPTVKGAAGQSLRLTSTGLEWHTPATPYPSAGVNNQFNVSNGAGGWRGADIANNSAGQIVPRNNTVSLGTSGIPFSGVYANYGYFKNIRSLPGYHINITTPSDPLYVGINGYRFPPSGNLTDNDVGKVLALTKNSRNERVIGLVEESEGVPSEGSANTLNVSDGNGGWAPTNIQVISSGNPSVAAATTGSIIPTTHELQDIGSSEFNFRTLYAKRADIVQDVEVSRNIEVGGTINGYPFRDESLTAAKDGWSLVYDHSNQKMKLAEVSGGGGDDPRFDLPIAISQGGTGGITAEIARHNLNIYSKSEVDDRTGTPTLAEVLLEGNDIPLLSDITYNGENFMMFQSDGSIDIYAQNSDLSIGRESSVLSLGQNTKNTYLGYSAESVFIGYDETEVYLNETDLYVGDDERINYKMPPGRGEINQVLTQKANGVTAWETPSGGGGNDPRFDLPVTISQGGTSANTAQGARTNLDVYSKGEVDDRTVTPGLNEVLSEGNDIPLGTGITAGGRGFIHIFPDGAAVILVQDKVLSVGGRASVLNLGATATRVNLGEHSDEIYIGGAGAGSDIYLDPSNLRIGRTTMSNYKMPKYRGEINQVLTQKANGVTVWETPSGGGGGNDPRFDLPISISQGGTAANTVQGARANLDVYSKSEVDGRTGIPALQEVINAGGSLYRGTVISGENGTKLINYISNINNVVLLGENLQAIYLRSDNLVVGRTDEISYTIPTKKGNIGQILKLNESSNLEWADESASSPSQGRQYNINTSDGLGGWERSTLGINTDGDLVPAVTDAQDLGTEDYRFKDIHTKNLYVGGNEIRPVYGDFYLESPTPFTGTFGLEDELIWNENFVTEGSDGDKDFEFEDHGGFQYIKFNRKGLYRIKVSLTISKPIQSNNGNTIKCYLKRRFGNGTPAAFPNTEFYILTNDGAPLNRSFYFEMLVTNVTQYYVNQDFQIQLVMEVSPSNSNYLVEGASSLALERILN